MVGSEPNFEIQGNLQGSVHSRLSNGLAVVASFDSVADTGWTVVVAQPAGLVGQDVGEIRTKTLYLMGVALLLSVFLGLLGTQQLLRPILSLRDSEMHTWGCPERPSQGPN